MIVYCKTAIEFGMKKCMEQPKYRVLVAIPDSKLKELKSFIKKVRHKGDVDYEIRETKGCLTVVFTNGSALYTVSTAEETKGRPVHLAIVDENVTNDFIMKVILRLEVLEFKARRRHE